jgi:hypothetical protein
MTRACDDAVLLAAWRSRFTIKCSKVMYQEEKRRRRNF